MTSFGCRITLLDKFVDQPESTAKRACSCQLGEDRLSLQSACHALPQLPVDRPFSGSTPDRPQATIGQIEVSTADLSVVDCGFADVFGFGRMAAQELLLASRVTAPNSSLSTSPLPLAHESLHLFELVVEPVGNRVPYQTPRALHSAESRRQQQPLALTVWWRKNRRATWQIPH